MRLQLSLLLLCILLLMACAQPVTPAAPQHAAPADTAQLIVQTDTPQATTPAAPCTPAEELDALLAAGESQRFTVQYRVTGEHGGGALSPMTLEVVAADGKMRRTSVVETENGTIEERIYVLPDDVVLCEHDEEWRCFYVPDAPPREAPAPNATVTPAPGRRVAGVNARCFSVTAEPTLGVVVAEDYCLSPEGVVLYHELRTPDDRMLSEATSFSRSLPDDAFVLPASPTVFAPPDAYAAPASR